MSHPSFTKAVAHLTTLLHVTMRQLADEQYSPRLSSDASDDLMKHLKLQVRQLQTLRAELELCMTGALL